jgi:hypothetical protein
MSYVTCPMNLWLVMLAQVWSGLCKCSKCEADPDHSAQLWKNCFSFKINFQWQNYSKFNISHTLGLKIMKHLYRILFIEGFSTIPHEQPNLLQIFNSYFIEFLMKICTVGLNIMKPPWSTLARLFKHTKSVVGTLWSGKPSHTKQTNKQTFIINWLVWLVLLTQVWIGVYNCFKHK